MATTTHLLGYPRIGQQRQLKFALERYWQQESSEEQLLQVGRDIRHDNWHLQAEHNLTFLTAGDFAWYDHVLATSLLLGHVPQRHRTEDVSLDTLFTIARGQSVQACCGGGQAASDMTKWFNTNYHYIVPEFSADDQFDVCWTQLFDEVEEALALGKTVKPVLLGPVSYLYLGKSVDPSFDRLALLPQLINAYQNILQRLANLGVEWVQIDEPILALDLDHAWINAFKPTYQALHGSVKLLLTTYFDGVEHVCETLTQLQVDGLHIDVVASPEQLDSIVASIPNHWVLSLGVINGRNVWRANLAELLERLTPVKHQLGERLWLSSSCSLLHTPVDLDSEQTLSDEQRGWFAFAKQKVAELALLSAALDGDEAAFQACIHYSMPIEARKHAETIHKPQVAQRVAEISPQLSQRTLPYVRRAEVQKQTLGLPFLPTTTIGSFPQTGDIRGLRRQFKLGNISAKQYDVELKRHIADAVTRQEALDLDVLVHGEAERNDMVEYFAENLDGFLTTQFGWVQSYGSRCVKPAIVVADIERTQPITVDWSIYAQSLTKKGMKGMLTGPVTILCWTFPREDISRKTITQQLALALRDEVNDLQNANINIIQIDEPAIREGLPLKASQHKAYLNWAVEAFRIAASSAKPGTQIHTHMCYSEFNEIIDSIADLDADVITIETSRSNMELLRAFEKFNYPNEIGPGVYDIHSPNVPSEEWIKSLIKKAAQLIPPERLWVNPDCGLKTRGWRETEASLKNMVAAAKALREELT
jgi:5-methyltetrahydropteroyltriglutamate--homocysteine methyltransferase